MNIPPHLRVELYLSWHCGDGCCSNSQRLVYPAGQFATTEQLCAQAERDNWIYGFVHDDSAWLRVEQQTDDLIEFVYETPEEETDAE